ncbi:MAG: hypothetical protein ACEQSX_05830 [Baekduiaceae bacterium]
MTRRLLFCILSFATTLIAAAPAQAGLGTWTSLGGLTSASNADWVREYVRASPPNVTHMYAATEDDGVFRSQNSGVTWSAFNSGLEGIPGAKNVRTVYADGSRMLAGTGAGLFASTNGGAWQPLAQGPEEDPQNPKKLNVSVQALFKVTGGALLAGGFSSGVWRSGDNGNTWIPPQPGNGMPAATTVWQLDSLIPGVVFAATSSGIYRSLNGGASWQLRSDGFSGTALRIVADGTKPNILYALSPGSGVYRSINAGETWAPINGSGAKALGNLTVRALLQFSGVNETRLYVGTADGMYVGTTKNVALGGVIPGATTWRKVTESGLAVGNSPNDIFWTLWNSVGAPGTIFAGTQSNGGYTLTMTPPVPIAPDPVVSGTRKVGATLSATNGGWTGTQTIEFTYQWQNCTTASESSCSDIDGAEQSTYTLQPSDFNDRVRVIVTGENDVPAFAFNEHESALTGLIGAAPGTLPGANQSSTGSITGPGLPTSGDTLTVPTAGGSAPLFNPVADSRKYSWYRCLDATEASCTLLFTSNANTYVLSDLDVTFRIRAKVTGTNQFGSTTLGFTGATNTIFPKQATNLLPPSILGTAMVGESLVANVGTWQFPGTSFERQWIRCDAAGGSCETLSGQKGVSYTLTAADLGKRLKAEIKADSNGPNTVPGPTYVMTPLSGVVVPVPVPGAPAAPGGGAIPGAGQQQSVAPPPPLDTTKPVLAVLSLTSATVKAGGTLTIAYRPTESSSLRVQVQRLTKGRKVGKACKTGRKKGKRCTIAKTVLTKTYPAATGAAKVKLALKTRGKKLPAGNYQLVITPVDGAGNRGAARTVRFKITRR